MDAADFHGTFKKSVKIRDTRVPNGIEGKDFIYARYEKVWHPPGAAFI